MMTATVSRILKVFGFSFAVAVGVSAKSTPLRAQSSVRWVPLDPEYTVYIDVPDGRVVVELSRDFAPQHVEQFRLLAREGHYQGYSFARVIEGFLAQAAEPTHEKEIRTGREALPAEFERDWSDSLPYISIDPPDQFGEESGLIRGFPVRRSLSDGKVWITRCPGILGFARQIAPNTGRSQFWITLQNVQANDRNDTAFGRVVWGMEYISRLPRTEGFDFEAGTPVVSVRVAADLPLEERLQLEVLDTSDPTTAKQLEAWRQGATGGFYVRPPRPNHCSFVPPARPVQPR